MNTKLRNMTSIYLLRDNNVLLLLRQGGRVVNDVWTGSAGGHFEEYELNNPEACVMREMNEELGIDRNDIENLRLRYITLRITKGEVRQNYYFFADLKKGNFHDYSSNEGKLKWFPIDAIDKLEMPYTAKYVVDHYVTIGRFTSEIYVGTADGHEVKFIAMPEYV